MEHLFVYNTSLVYDEPDEGSFGRRINDYNQALEAMEANCKDAIYSQIPSQVRVGGRTKEIQRIILFAIFYVPLHRRSDDSETTGCCLICL
ncbi:hypothetical protein D3C87_1189120 [compost metagenome]